MAKKYGYLRFCSDGVIGEDELTGYSINGPQFTAYFNEDEHIVHPKDRQMSERWLHELYANERENSPCFERAVEVIDTYVPGVGMEYDFVFLKGADDNE